MVRYNWSHPLMGGVSFPASPLEPPPPMRELTLDELSTDKQADKLIAELNLYGTGIRERLIEHLEAAEERARGLTCYDDWG